MLNHYRNEREAVKLILRGKRDCPSLIQTP
jgi:hypothetical protein